MVGIYRYLDRKYGRDIQVPKQEMWHQIWQKNRIRQEMKRKIKIKNWIAKLENEITDNTSKN